MVSPLTFQSRPTDDAAEVLVRGFVAGLLAVWPIWMLLGLIALAYVMVGIGRRVLRDRRLARSGIDEIDRFGGEAFEQYLTVLFRRLGYTVERTRFRGDYGGDLVLRKAGIRTVVQAKRHSRSVGVDAVQQAVAAKGYYKCAEAMVVTNSRYTRHAEILARENGVELWDRGRLIGELASARARDEPRGQHVQSESPPSPDREGGTVVAALPSVQACAVCSRVLTDGERRFCEQHTSRFGGRMLCFEHQRSHEGPRPRA